MIGTILTILFAHFFADYVVQPRKWATQKWTSDSALGKHTLVYTLSLFIWCWFFFSLTSIDWDMVFILFIWAAINGCLHFVVDSVTSRDAHQFWMEKDDELYYATLGIDQTLHYAILAVTYMFFFDFLF
jgi:membrane-bound metal-dependent hydrolase YbcI (DUF457 family)